MVTDGVPSESMRRQIASVVLLSFGLRLADLSPRSLAPTGLSFAKTIYSPISTR